MINPEEVTGEQNFLKEPLPFALTEKQKRQLQSSKKKTDFGDMRLWIIQDDIYSDLRQAKGCESFSDLSST